MKQRTHGFVTTEVVLGMSVVVALAILLGVELNRQQQATQTLIEHRAAMRRMEAAFTTLQTRTPEQGRATLAEGAISVARLDAPAPVAGWAWVELATPLHEGRVTLTGVVPETALPGGGGAVEAAP